MQDNRQSCLVHDSLYGQIELPGYAADLLGTSELLRLCRISHCALPLELSRHGSSDGGSKYVHTRGVAYLVLEATRAIRRAESRALSEKMARLLVIAALWHDAGSPPFTHITEKVMHRSEQLGMDHEQRVAHMLPSSEFARIAGLTADDIVCVQRIVTGHLRPYSELLKGVLDLDSVDGVLRFAKATGYGHLGRIYRPLKIARAFRVTRDQGQCYLQLGSGLEAELEAYQRSRAETWDILYSAPHRSPEAMLHRAIQLAARYRNFPKEFFCFTDESALDFLLCTGNQEVITLIRQAVRSPYRCVFARVTSRDDECHRRFTQSVGGRVVDFLCRQLPSVSPEAACGYSGCHYRTKPFHRLLVREGVGDLRLYGRHPLFQEHWGTQVYMLDAMIGDGLAKEVQQLVENQIFFHSSSERLAVVKS